MSLSVPIDTREIAVTPVFKFVTVEDIAASEREGKPVMKTIEAVEVRFAGSKNYAPVFPVNAMWKREGHRVITYAERWADQYREFLAGNEQKAAGTPLEMLKPYGITPAQLSLCRALKIYSIEALHQLEGPNVKNLGMAANDLKRMADDYMADRAKGTQALSEVEKLRAEIERLKQGQAIPPEVSPEEVEQAVKAADDEFEAMSDDQIKDWIARKTGAGRPRGNPSRENLISMARELAA